MFSLFSRLSILFTFILVALGAMIWVIAHHSQLRYSEETTQQLNRPVAMYIAEQIPLFINGNFDHRALARLAAHVMIINPSLTLYLLDANGRVVGSANDDSQHSLANGTVDLVPVHSFLNATEQLPIYGDNPASPGQKSIFSAFPLADAGIGATGCAPCGYVYAVLGEARDGSSLQVLGSSQTLQIATLMLLAVLVCALLAGLGVFFMLTRPLRAMTASLAQWQLVASGNRGHQPPADSTPARTSASELETLEKTCHEMAQRLSCQYRELDEADQRRRGFLTRLSHDLRTPLTSVCGALETLSSKSQTMTSNERSDYVKVAYRQALRLNRMIDQVFELARLDSGDVALAFEPVCFQELAMDTVQELSPHAALNGVTLEYKPCASQHPPLINGDIGQLNRVLINLLSNAIRHSAGNGLVTVRTRVDAHQNLQVIVSDSGSGFPTTLEKRALATLDSNTGRAIPCSGTGLGLGIVSRILALHGSEATVNSLPGQGTEISFSLPRIAGT